MLKTIVYADDETDIRTIAQIALEAVGGFEVTVCESGMQAVEAARKHKPQLVLLDVMMPGMDGPETLKNLRADPALADIPVIFMTAKVRPEEVESLIALGALGVIAKPFDPMTLADEIRTLWDKR